MCVQYLHVSINVAVQLIFILKLKEKEGLTFGALEGVLSMFFVAVVTAAS